MRLPIILRRSCFSSPVQPVDNPGSSLLETVASVLFRSFLCFGVLVPSIAPAQVKPFRGAEYRTIQTQTYGRFEVRMRSANVSGMLASFFTYYDPANPWNEIDIENMGRYGNEVQFNTITPTQADNHVQRQVTAFYPHQAFHVYAFDWTPDYVSWRIDGAEVYRQTGAHIATLNRPQKIMMNIWQPSAVDWAGTFNRADLPVYAYYDWVKYYAYTPGVGDDFTLQWTDEFTAFDPSRWQKATHTWGGNNCQFVQQNVAFQDGYMILCLTDSVSSGYNGAAVVDADVDPPYLVSAHASLTQIRVLFSEALDRASAETTSNYLTPGVTVRSAVLDTNRRTVLLDVEGLNPNNSLTLTVLNVKDLAGRAMSAKQVKVVMPLPLPLRINVGGSVWGGYMADSVWDFSRQYGAVGGVPVQAPSTLDIAGTMEDELFRSAREGITAYKVRLPNGSYRVTLLAAETKHTAAGQRVFSVRAEGQPVLDQVDLIQLAGANVAAPLDLGNIAIADAQLDLSFFSVVDKPILSGIVVESIGTDVDGRGESRQREADYEFGVYPNPFNGGTTMTISVPEAGDLTVHIYDTLGRNVDMLRLGHRPRGEHSVRWDAGSLASGVYLCRLAAGREFRTKRVVVVK